MKKAITVLLLVAVVLASVSVAFASPSINAENEQLDAHVFYIERTNDGSVNYVMDDSVSPLVATYVYNSVIIKDWTDDYVVMTLKADVTSGAQLKSYSGYVEVTNTSVVNPTVYSFFTFSMEDHEGTDHLSDEKSSWIPTDVDVIKIKITNIRYENIYGDVGSGANDVFGPYRRN